MKKKSQTVKLAIHGYQKKGYGVGTFTREDGTEAVAEIPFTIRGEEAVVTTAGKSKGRYRAYLERLEKPSPLRVEARCAHFGVCGGCRWQHMAYEEQLRLKQEHVNKVFSEIPDCPPPEAIVSAVKQWRYRNKMEFTFSQDLAGNRFLGLMMDSSAGKVLNLEECHLVNGWYTETLEEVRQWWQECDLAAYRHHSNQGALRTLTVRESFSCGDRMVILTVSGNPDAALNKQQLKSFIDKLRRRVEPKDSDQKLSIVLRIQQTIKGMPTNFYEMILYGPDHLRETLNIRHSSMRKGKTLHFHVSPNAFFQSNSYQAAELYSLALGMADISEDTVVYDLFCGTGTIGICAALVAQQVIGVEVCAESVLDARKNAALNGLDHVEILSGPVRYMIPKILEEGRYPLPDLVILDPPRCGLDVKALNQVKALNAKQILYISCNPDTQAVDVGYLVQDCGYRVRAIQPLDQFAHTPHVENIVVLVR